MKKYLKSMLLSLISFFNHFLSKSILFINYFIFLSTSIFSKKDKERIVLINSNINYYEKSASILVDSLLEFGICADSIILCVGGAAKSEISIWKGVKTVFVVYNAFDFTSLIYICDNINQYLGVKNVFFMHDTMKIFSRRFSRLFYHYPLKNHMTYGIKEFPSMNIGFYSFTALEKYSTYLNGYKKIIVSVEDVQEMKAAAITHEDLIFKMNKINHQTLFNCKVNPLISNENYFGKIRQVEMYWHLGLIKYKSNFELKKQYDVNL